MAAFDIEKNVLLLRAPLTDADRETLTEELFGHLEALLLRPEAALVIDLTAAGTLGSMELALVHAAVQRVKEAGKTLRIRLERANRLALRISGAGADLPVEFV